MSKLPYKVWVAQYNTSVTYKGSYIMWQYTSTGKVNGISGVVDKSHSYYALGNAKPMTPTTTTTTTTKPALKSIDVIAKEVINGQWGSGDERKKKLTAAGYNYDAVQKKVNEIIAASIPARFQKANQWATNIANSGKYSYKVYNDNPNTHKCPICYPGSGNGWNCIGFATACWRHGAGISCRCSCDTIYDALGDRLLRSTNAEATRLVQNALGIANIQVVSNGGGTPIPLSKLKAGDLLILYDGNEYAHMAYYMGNGKYADSARGHNPTILANLTVSSYMQKQIKLAIRYTGK